MDNLKLFVKVVCTEIDVAVYHVLPDAWAVIGLNTTLYKFTAEYAGY